MTRIFGVDARFFLAALLLHALALSVGALAGQKAQYGVAASTGSALPALSSPNPQTSDDLNLDFSDQAWATAPPKRRPVAARPKAPQAPGTGETKESGSYLLNPHPPYPEEARRLRQEGQVLLKVQLDDQGAVQSVTVLKSSGFPLLDDSALQTVEGWKFKPARLGGVAVSSALDVPILFNLTD
jgi:protein TonB